MKSKIAICLSFIFLPLLGVADDVAEQIRLCEEVGEEARLAQMYNQDGVPMSVATKEFYDKFGKFGVSFVKMAYSYPSFVSDQMKNKTISEFENYIFDVCMGVVEDFWQELK